MGSGRKASGFGVQDWCIKVSEAFIRLCEAVKGVFLELLLGCRRSYMIYREAFFGRRLS